VSAFPSSRRRPGAWSPSARRDTAALASKISHHRREVKPVTRLPRSRGGRIPDTGGRPADTSAQVSDARTDRNSPPVAHGVTIGGVAAACAAEGRGLKSAPAIRGGAAALAERGSSGRHALASAQRQPPRQRSRTTLGRGRSSSAHSAILLTVPSALRHAPASAAACVSGSAPGQPCASVCGQYTGGGASRLNLPTHSRLRNGTVRSRRGPAGGARRREAGNHCFQNKLEKGSDALIIAAARACLRAQKQRNAEGQHRS
jgi:hypothetical protein